MKNTKEGVVKERPNFGNRQVRNVSEIEWGKKYREHYSRGSRIIILIQRKDNSKWIKIGVIYDDVPVVTDASLADCGVIPYEHDMWNKTNWLEKIKEVSKND